MKPLRFLYLLLLLAVLVRPFPASAFRPVAHVVLQKTIAQQLPPGNIFRQAMDSCPDFAAWGAVGPDLSYIPYKPLIRKIGYKHKWAASSNYADIAHYYRSGSFSRALLETALRSGDRRLIAFAAGWVTHVAGDFSAHHIFVYPDAGYYLDDHNGQSLHGEMERYAEPVIFIDKGKELKRHNDFYVKENVDAKTIFDAFFRLPFGVSKVHERKKKIRKYYMPIDSLLRAVFDSVYHEPLTSNIPYLMKQYDEALGKGVGKFKGFGIVSYEEATMPEHLDARQLERLDSAFRDAAEFGTDLLAHCQENGYAKFTDKWNLDVGPDKHTLVIKVKIGENRYSGSKNPLMIHLKLKTTQSFPLNFRIQVLGNVRYNRGDELYSYIYLDECDVDPDVLYRFTVSKGGKLKDKTRIAGIRIEHNGRPVYQSRKEIILNRKTAKSEEFIFEEPLRFD